MAAHACAAFRPGRASEPRCPLNQTVPFLFRLRPGDDFSGGHGGEETPVPIPNTEVKGPIAEGTARFARGRVGRRREFLRGAWLCSHAPLFLRPGGPAGALPGVAPRAGPFPSVWAGCMRARLESSCARGSVRRRGGASRGRGRWPCLSYLSAWPMQ